MTTLENKITITDVIGEIPYRMALAGGWIDQPFVSRHNPKPPGSMVVVSLQPTMLLMDRCGMGTSTRKVMMQIWNGKIPEGNPMELVRKAYAAENEWLRDLRAHPPSRSGHTDHDAYRSGSRGKPRSRIRCRSR